MIQTDDSLDIRRRTSKGSWPVLVAIAAGLVVGVFVWAAPREAVAVPGPDASPEQVVRAYIDAVNGRDFDTANAIDARPGEELGRFSRPMRTHEVEMGKTTLGGTEFHVLFTADFDGGEGTIEDGSWGYYVERGHDGLWHITDAGVA